VSYIFFRKVEVLLYFCTRVFSETFFFFNDNKFKRKGRFRIFVPLVDARSQQSASFVQVPVSRHLPHYH